MDTETIIRPPVESAYILDRLFHDGVTLEECESVTIVATRGRPLTINGVVADHRVARAVVESPLYNSNASATMNHERLRSFADYIATFLGLEHASIDDIRLAFNRRMRECGYV